MTNELKMLIKNGLKPQVNANFSSADANSAALNALLEAAGISKDATLKEVKRNPAAFAIIEEAVDEMLPLDLQNVLGQFAEVKTFARDAEVIFKTENVGKRRARLSITRGARGGIYRAARLDSKQFQMDTTVYTVGIYVTLEDVLSGQYTLAELYANILDGFEQIVYKDVISALQSAHVSGGHNYITVGSGASTLNAALDEAIAKVRQYGAPTIIGFREAIAGINNVDTVGTPNRSVADVDDIRAKGFVQLYKGVPVVEIPNFLVDETNEEWLVGGTDLIFVIPANSKPVKVAFKGEIEVVENKQATGSEKWEAHKLMGVGVALANDFFTIDVQA